MKKILIATASLVVAFASCKPKAQDGSSVASLDNMTRDAGAALSTNFCGIKLDKDSAKNLSAKDRRIIARRIDAPSDALRYAVAGALTAVPRTMQRVFFSTAGGKIQVVSDVQAKCDKGGPSEAKKRFFAEARKSGESYQLDGCWSAEGENLMIYVKDDAEKIHHGLLRVFASAYADFFTARLKLVGDKLPASSRAEMTKRVERFDRQKAAVARALLMDLETQDPKKAEAFAELKKEDEAAFESQVFAETIDSAYCSTATANVLDTKFPNVAKVVNQGADSFIKDFGEPAQ